MYISVLHSFSVKRGGSTRLFSCTEKQFGGNFLLKMVYYLLILKFDGLYM
jgi:hypothetical protein